ncbi:MAG: hypothetical protein KDL87_05895, partial [Verrucomicrobiae bacterium]|nr:hypothetical protein [Verrucomicrobiae bacterium]
MAESIAAPYEVDPALVEANLVALLANLVGPQARCLVAGRRIPIGFNVLTVLPDGAASPPGWLSFLLGPLHAHQDRLQDTLLRVGEETLRRQRLDLERDLQMNRAAGKSDAELAPLHERHGSLGFGLAPRFLETGFRADRLRWSLLHCADGGVLAVDSRQGFAAALEEATPSERSRLGRWLRESGDGEVLLLDRRSGAAGSLTLVRSLSESDLERPGLRQFLGGTDPVPILMVPQWTPGRWLPSGEPDAEW